MAQYKKSAGVQGAWVDKAKLSTGMRAKIVSETNPMPSAFQDDNGKMKMQDVCKVRFEGMTDPVNVSLNRPTIDGLVEAFGEESVKWQGNYLTVEIEHSRIGGKNRTIMYLVPEGYEKFDDDNGYARIAKKLAKNELDREYESLESLNDKKEDIKPEAIPF